MRAAEEDERVGNENEPGTPEPPKGRSTAFIIVVVVAVLLFLGVCCMGILATLLMPALLKAKHRANEVKCSNNLKQIGMAAIQYADDNRFYPFDASDLSGQKVLETLVEKNTLDREALTCPEDAPGTVSYEGFTVDRIPANAPSDLPLAWDRKPHSDGRRNVVFLDCHTMRVDERDFAELQAKLHEYAERKPR